LSERGKASFTDAIRFYLTSSAFLALLPDEGGVCTMAEYLKSRFGVNAGMDHSPVRMANDRNVDEEKMKGPKTKSSFTQMRTLNNCEFEPRAFRWYRP
jgi:hypothetical protein